MPLLVNSVPNLAQGVSQQPDNLRYPGQCDEQINAWATVVEGLVKRPPTKYKKNVQTSAKDSDKLFTHFVKRDETNKYCVTVSLGNVSLGIPAGVGVINLNDGTNYPITVTSIASSYLSLGTSVTNPLKDIRALTVADYTFLVNKKKEVKVDTDPKYLSKDVKDDNGKYNALVFAKLGDYEKGYSIYIDGKLIPPGGTGVVNTHHDFNTQTAPSQLNDVTYISGPSSGGNAAHADTEYISKGLETCLKAYFGADGIVAGITLSGGSGFEPSRTAQREGTTITYSFSIEQFEDDGTGDPDLNAKVGYGAGGTLVIGSSGGVQNWDLTHKGTGYDGTQTVSGVFDKPFVLTITRHEAVSKQSSSNLYSGQSSGTRKYTTETTKTVYTSFPSTPGVVMPSFVPVVPGGSNFTISRMDSIIKIQGDADFSIRSEDGLSNEGLGIVYKEVESITDLPKKCYHDFRVRIRGDADVDQDDYYVVFQTKDREEFGEGSWVETVGWDDGPESKRASKGIDTTIDYTTMPIVLVADGYDEVTGEVVGFTLQTPNEYGNIVKNYGVYYNLVEDHISNSSNEPGVGVDWQNYWVSIAGIDSAQVWRTNITYAERPVGYGQRAAGDNGTNPFPSFVGSTINDVFFFKNRLGFLTDSNIIFSEADEYFNFFRTTTQQLLDSAPIDVGLSHTKVAVLQHAVPFQEKLMLFSKQSQFVLRGADVLSPKTVAISPVTEYDISDTVEPIALGNYIYFTFKRNDFEGMYEYFVDNNTETFHSEEITSQIPKYITADVKQIAGSQSENTIVVGTSKDPKTLFVYKYFWSNKEKIQSAWMKFTFGRDVRGFDFIDSNLHMLTADSEGLHLESLTLEDGLKDTDLDYTLYLDSRVDGSALTTSYDAPSKTTTISGFPFDPVNVNIYTKKGHKVAFTKTTSTAGTVSGTLANYVTHSGTIYKCETTHTSPSSFVAVDTSVTPNITYWTVSTDVATAPEWVAGKFYNNEKYFFAGIPYNMLYRFSDQTLKQPTERGGRSASDYAFQTIRNGSIDYAETGHFTVEVTPKYRDTYSYAFNPDIVGANLTLNTFVPQSGHFRFPVQAQPNEATIEVKSSSALPVKLLAAEFESMMIPRSRRYGA